MPSSTFSKVNVSFLVSNECKERLLETPNSQLPSGNWVTLLMAASSIIWKSASFQKCENVIPGAGHCSQKK